MAPTMNVQQKLPILLSSVALGVAILGATPAGQAAARLIVPSNSVGTLQLKPGSVTDTKIRRHSLTASAFKVGQLPTGAQGVAGQTGPQGPQGAQGAQGAQGSQGPAGPAGISGYHIAAAASGPVAPGAKGLAIAMCNQGEKALGGGIVSATANAKWTIQYLYPSDNAPRFLAVAFNETASPAEFSAYAVCATVAS
jgi:hypothetical protein